MTMRGILVHVDEHRALQSVLSCALLAARRFNGQMDGLHARPGAPRIIPVAPEGAFIPASEIVEDLERADRDLDRQLRERFESVHARARRNGGRQRAARRRSRGRDGGMRGSPATRRSAASAAPTT